MNDFHIKFVHKYDYKSYLFSNTILSDAQIIESLDKILQDIDSEDNFLDYINFVDAVDEDNLEGNLFILHNYFLHNIYYLPIIYITIVKVSYYCLYNKQ